MFTHQFALILQFYATGHEAILLKLSGDFTMHSLKEKFQLNVTVKLSVSRAHEEKLRILLLELKCARESFYDQNYIISNRKSFKQVLIRSKQPCLRAL